MKNRILVLLFFTLSCHQAERQVDGSLPDEERSIEWITYEGRVPLDESRALYIEVSLRETLAGQGQFRMVEYLEATGKVTDLSSFSGNYTTLYGQTPSEQLIQFQDTRLTEPLRRSYPATTPASQDRPARKVIREESFRDRDLVVRISGRYKLLILDHNMNTLSDEREHNLLRRMAKPFTVEGYFRHNGFSADFREMNTGEKWQVFKAGDYQKAIRQYYQLTEKKFEVAYLKGIGFPARVTNEDGTETEVLVIKRVLQMTSATDVNL